MPKPPETAREYLIRQINDRALRIYDLESELAQLVIQNEKAEALIPYTSCKSCDMELVGREFEAEQERLFAEAFLGKRTMACRRCDAQAICLLTVKEWNSAFRDSDGSESWADRHIEILLAGL